MFGLRRRALPAPLVALFRVLRCLTVSHVSFSRARIQQSSGNLRLEDVEVLQGKSVILNTAAFEMLKHLILQRPFCLPPLESELTSSRSNCDS